MWYWLIVKWLGGGGSGSNDGDPVERDPKEQINKVAKEIKEKLDKNKSEKENSKK